MSFSILLNSLKNYLYEQISLLTPRTDWWPQLTNPKSLRTDILTGVLVAAVIIPNSLAYSLLAGLPPSMGLYAALIAIPVAALWGSSSYVITGPVGIVSLLTATALLPFATPGTSDYVTLAILLALLVGTAQVFLGVVRLGVVARLIPHSTIIGFTTAAAIIISLVQLPNLFGLSLPRHEYIYQNIFNFILNLNNIHIPTAILGISTLIFIFIIRRLKIKIPVLLLTLFVTIIFSFFLPLSEWGIKLVGGVSSGLPHLTMAPLNLVTIFSLMGTATIIALVGFVETYAIAQSLARKNREQIDPDRELVGQGFANVGASLVGGLPVSGSFSVSALNSNAGATSIISAFSATLVIILVLLLFTPIFKFIPQVTLSAIVIVAVLQLVDIKKIKEAWQLSEREGFIILITFLTSLFLKPDQGIFIGILVALILFLRRVMQPQIVEVGLHSEYGSLWTLRHEGVQTFPELLIIRLDMPLIYSNSVSVIPTIKKIYKEHLERTKIPPRALVLVCSGVNQIDLSGVEMLYELEEYAKSKSMELCFMVVKDLVYDIFERADLLPRLRYLNGNQELIAYADLQHQPKN